MASKSKVPTINANQAIQDWIKAHPDQKIDEAEEVSLQFCHPPIKIMGDKIAQLANCKKLSVSTNNIEEIGLLPPRVEILAIGRNLLKKLDRIDKAAATLQQLWMSYNNVKSFGPLVNCKRLRVLYAAHNNVDKLSEIDKLSQLPCLEDLVLIGNPIWEDLNKKGTYQNEMTKRLKKLQVLDGQPLAEVKQEEDGGSNKQGGTSTQRTTGQTTGQPSGGTSGAGSRSVSPRPDTSSAK